MRPIYTEVIIPQGDGKSVFSSHRIRLRIDDHAGGPFLSVEGINDEPDAGETGHEFFLNDESEVEEFAAICKELLRKAEAVITLDTHK